MSNKRTIFIPITVLSITATSILYIINFLWVELPKITRKANGEGFIHQKIDEEEVLCYLVKGINFGYDLRIIDNKIYIKYKETITLDKLDWLANLSSHAEDLKLNSKQNKFGYYCTDFSDFYL